MKKSVLIIVFQFLTGFLLAQHYPFLNYTTHNGLPQIQVQELFQDSKGYIWIGTKGGLAKFNGEQFENFLPNEYVKYIGETRTGDVVVATRNNLYRYLRGQMQRIAPIQEPVKIVAGDSSVWMVNNQKIEEFSNGILVNTFKTGNNITTNVRSAVFDFNVKKLYFNFLSDNTIYSLKNGTIGKQDNLPYQADLINFNNGAACYILRNNKLCIAVDPETKTEFYRYDITGDVLNDIRISELPVKQHLINRFYSYALLDSTGGAKYLHLPVIKVAYTLIVDRDNNFWAGTDNGLYQISNGPVMMYPREFMNDFWSMIKGKDGNFYGGAYREGLYLLDMENQVKREIIAPGPFNGRETDYYYGASKDLKGNLYFPSHNGLVKYNYLTAKKFDTGVSLISKFDPFSKRIIFGQPHGFGFIGENEKIEYKTDMTEEIVKTPPASFGFSPNGDIWIGTWNNLSVYNREKDTFVQASARYKTCPGGVISMNSDYRQNLWMGGIQGLWLYRANDDSLARVDHHLFSSYVLSVVSPDPTTLLIGTSYEIYAMNLQKYYNSGQVELKMYNFRNGFVSEEIAQNGFLVDGSKVYVPSTTCTSVIDLKKISYKPEFFGVIITKVNGTGLTNGEQSGKATVHAGKSVNKLEFNVEQLGFGLPTKSKFSYRLDGVDKKWGDWTEQTFVSYSNLASGNYVFRARAQNGSILEEFNTAESKVLVRVTLPFYREPRFYQYAFFVLLLLSFIVAYLWWIWYRGRLKIANREKHIKFLEIATLQAQLNPHFIFNFLSSVQSLISREKPEEANGYLVKFSRLMRSYMESSIKTSKILSGSPMENESTLKEEIDLLKMYIELEKIKYPPDKINYRIFIENDGLLNKTLPPMILQPFVENAIKHGILPKEGPGTLHLLFSGDGDRLQCIIRDDGIGRKQSLSFHQTSIKATKSRGLELIQKRIDALNELGYGIKIKYEDPPDGGTSVEIIFDV